MAKANKVAKTRLKLAHQYMSNSKDKEFYTEIVNALWGYLSDKLSIPTSQLIRENISTELQNYGADAHITNEVIEETRKCSELAPLHNPAAILGIEACKKIAPQIPMVAVFDTAFHQTIPKERYIYPIPYLNVLYNSLRGYFPNKNFSPFTSFRNISISVSVML